MTTLLNHDFVLFWSQCCKPAFICDNFVLRLTHMNLFAATYFCNQAYIDDIKQLQDALKDLFAVRNVYAIEVFMILSKVIKVGLQLVYTQKINMLFSMDSMKIDILSIFDN